MRYLTRLAASVMAALVVTAVAASAASAAPEWFKGGKKLGSGVVDVETVSTKAPVLESAFGNKLTCTASVSHGEITGATTATSQVTYTGCTEGSSKCQNTATEGEIVTEPLTASNIYVANTKKEKAGEQFKPSSGTNFVSYKCTGSETTFKVTGEVIGEATPLGKEETTGKLIFEKGEKVGKQKYEGKEGKSESIHLTAFGFVAADIVDTEDVKFYEHGTTNPVAVELHKT
jgi:hypothetical protein